LDLQVFYILFFKLNCFYIFIILLNSTGALNSKSRGILDVVTAQETFKSVYDWRCVVLGLEADHANQTFYLGMGRNNVFRWEITKSRWQKVMESIELARDTLVYAELVQELRGEGRSQKRSYALHIIDAVCLGGVDVSQLHLKER
jgi:cap1 methyltransferase